MSLLAAGDPLPHSHVLPPVPTVRTKGREQRLVNAVAECSACRERFVSREDPEVWAGIRWVPLRWWHRKAQRKLRHAQ